MCFFFLTVSHSPLVQTRSAAVYSNLGQKKLVLNSTTFITSFYGHSMYLKSHTRSKKQYISTLMSHSWCVWKCIITWCQRWMHSSGRPSVGPSLHWFLEKQPQLSIYEAKLAKLALDIECLWGYEHCSKCVCGSL